MGNETEFETRNGREIGNKTEFNMRNGCKWETRQDKRNFSTENEKKERTGKTGEKHKKTKKKTMGKKRKITRNTETTYYFGETSFLRDKISGNAENGNENKNEAFSNVTKRQFA